jgi:hypothetical protein
VFHFLSHIDEEKKRAAAALGSARKTIGKYLMKQALFITAASAGRNSQGVISAVPRIDCNQASATVVNLVQLPFCLFPSFQ